MKIILKYAIIPLAFIAVTSAASPAIAQTRQTSVGLARLTPVGLAPTNPDSALQAVLDALDGTPLSLEEAIQQALVNATSVRRAEAAYMAAAGAVRREAGLFDPELFFDLTYQDQKQAAASFFAGAPILATQQATSQSGLRMALPTGTRLALSLNAVRLSTNSQFASLHPEFGAFGSLSLRQPLLQGFGSSARKHLTRAEHEFEAGKARYDQLELAIRAEVERTYWDLYAAERDYAVQKLIRDRTGAFLSETELRAKAGLVGPNQVANARTFLAEQELLFLERDEQLFRASDRLAALIGVRPASEALRFIPVDDPPGDFPLEPLEVLVQRALDNNLDLRASQEDVEAVRALASAAAWETLPSIDVTGSLGGNGLAGTPQPINFPGIPAFTAPEGSFGDALSQVTRRNFPSWSVGVEVSIPLGLRSGLGEKDRLEAQVEAAQQTRTEMARLLENEVRATYRELSHGKERLKAAREGVEAAQEQSRIGLIEFHNGRATAFELVRLGEDFAVAQQRYSAALVRTAKAAATLRQLTSDGYDSAKTK